MAATRPSWDRRGGADQALPGREAARGAGVSGHRVQQRHLEVPGGLTERELEVLLVLVRGDSNLEIGQRLGISAKTVGHHVQHVYEKAGVRNRAAATLWAFEHDLVPTGRGSVRCRRRTRGTRR